jgi:Ca2+:H+ antiporter
VPYLRSDSAPGDVAPADATAGGRGERLSGDRAQHPPADRGERPEEGGAGHPAGQGRHPADDGAEGRAGDGVRTGPRLSLGLTLVLLIVAGAASAFVSDWFVNGLQPAISILHISQAFAGLVIVAIAGNAVENTAGLVLSYKGRSDLAISVVKNSVAQIAAFLFPLLVLVSLLLATTLTFALAPVYIGALALTALALWQVTGDGEAAEFEGWALVALYVILATLTLYE